ncbi:MAG: hypothetical protein AABO41_16885 [Acidobacteriota bacterium]
MKRQLFIFSILSVVLAAGIAMAQTPVHKHQIPPLLEQIKPQQPEIQKAAVEFTEPVKLLGVILRGSYLFLHDEAKMERGEPCTSVYGRGETGKFDKLVASFHCIPVNREEPAKQFMVIIAGMNSPFTMPEVVEYRFAGSIEGHQVPRASE